MFRLFTFVIHLLERKEINDALVMAVLCECHTLLAVIRETPSYSVTEDYIRDVYPRSLCNLPTVGVSPKCVFISGSFYALLIAKKYLRFDN